MKRQNEARIKTDILIVGSGCSGLYAALNLPRDKQILLITKSDLESSDSYLAQGGICMLKEDDDFDSFYEDTLKAGHYENDKKSVEIMIWSSRQVISDLMSYGTNFHRHADGSLDFTREAAHSDTRILFHRDETGKEITSHLLEAVKQLPNVTLMEYTTLLDIIEKDNVCYGAVIAKEDGSIAAVESDFVFLATGGIGGLYRHSTNFRHLTGDSLGIALKHNIRLKDVNYIQIHPTTFYTEDPGERSFLISESVRGEGAKLYDKNMQRFTDELLPRDLLTIEVYKQMEKDGTDFVWEDLRTMPHDELHKHFPNIVRHCLEHGYDPDKQCIPVVPAQHYFMGGIWVNHQSRTSMRQLYAIGETACNGVHGKNRLASNSLLESLVFARRATAEVKLGIFPIEKSEEVFETLDLSVYENAEAVETEYRTLVRAEIDRINETADHPVIAEYRDEEE